MFLGRKRLEKGIVPCRAIDAVAFKTLYCNRIDLYLEITPDCEVELRTKYFNIVSCGTDVVVEWTTERDFGTSHLQF